MNNPELVCALCDQVEAEIEALKKATCNAKNAVNNETRDLFSEIQITHVVHLQKLTIALTSEMTPDESAEFDEQMENSEGQAKEE